MHLSDLIPSAVAAHAEKARIAPLEITGISSDSRKVAPGHLFVAIHGSSNDGRAYAASAVEAGAIAILTDERAFDDSLTAIAKTGVPVMTSDDPRRDLARRAAR